MVSSHALDISHQYLDEVIRTTYRPDALLLYSSEEVQRILLDPTRFIRVAPDRGLTSDSLEILSSWTVFRNDDLQKVLRVLLSTCLTEVTSSSVLRSIDESIQRIVTANVGRGIFDVCKSLSNEITHLLLSRVGSISLDQVLELHEASERVDVIGGRVSGGQNANDALALFCRTASETPFFSVALRKLRADGQTIDHETITNNVGMLLYAFFGPLPAALTNIVLAMSLDNRWMDPESFVPREWVHEGLRLFSPTAAIDRTATEDLVFLGRPMKCGQIVRCVVATANRDPALFARPHEFNPQRSKAIGHLGFGRGAHECVATRLAEHIGSSLVRQLAAHAGGVTLASTCIKWGTAINAAGPVELLVELVPRNRVGS